MVVKKPTDSPESQNRIGTGLFGHMHGIARAAVSALLITLVACGGGGGGSSGGNDGGDDDPSDNEPADKAVSGGTPALAWEFPNGIGDNKRLIITTDGTHDFGPGPDPDHVYYEDFRDETVGTAYNVGKSDMLTSQRIDGGPEINDEVTLMGGKSYRTRNANGARNAYEVALPDADASDGKMLHSEFMVKYSMRIINDVNSSGEIVLPNMKPVWSGLGDGGRGSITGPEDGNDIVLLGSPGGSGAAQLIGGNSTEYDTGSPAPRSWGGAKWNTNTVWFRMTNTQDRPDYTERMMVWRSYQDGGSRFLGEVEEGTKQILKTTPGHPTIWDKTITYNTGDKVWDSSPGQSGRNYISDKDNNTGNEPPKSGDEFWTNEGKAFAPGQPVAWNSHIVGGFFQNKGASEADAMYFDGVLIQMGDNALAHTFLGDNWEMETVEREVVAEPVSWSSDRIEVNVNLGHLTQIEGSTLHIQKANEEHLALRLTNDAAQVVDETGVMATREGITDAGFTTRIANTETGSDVYLLVMVAVEEGDTPAAAMNSVTVNGAGMMKVGRYAEGSEKAPAFELWALQNPPTGDLEVAFDPNKTDGASDLLVASHVMTGLTDITSDPIGKTTVGNNDDWSWTVNTTRDNSKILSLFGTEFQTTSSLQTGSEHTILFRNKSPGNQDNGIGAAFSLQDAGTAGEQSIKVRQPSGGIERKVGVSFELTTQ